MSLFSSSLYFVFFFYCFDPHLDLHSFPTRRSSDLLLLHELPVPCLHRHPAHPGSPHVRRHRGAPSPPEMGVDGCRRPPDPRPRVHVPVRHVSHHPPDRVRPEARGEGRVRPWSARPAAVLRDGAAVRPGPVGPSAALSPPAIRTSGRSRCLHGLRGASCTRREILRAMRDSRPLTSRVHEAFWRGSRFHPPRNPSGSTTRIASGASLRRTLSRTRWRGIGRSSKGTATSTRIASRPARS